MSNSVVLHVEESAGATLHVSEDSTSLKIGGQFYAIDAPYYRGDYEITPTQSTQILEMEGMRAAHNVVVNPIPSNYGLITYNGSVITVS